MARITCALVKEGNAQQWLLEFWSDLTGYHGQRRKFWVGLASLPLRLGWGSIPRLSLVPDC